MHLVEALKQSTDGYVYFRGRKATIVHYKDKTKPYLRYVNELFKKTGVSLNEILSDEWLPNKKNIHKFKNKQAEEDRKKSIEILMKEVIMKDRIQIDGVWYKREDTLLVTDETLRIISVEPFYRENGEFLRLMFDMPSAKFNVGDELAIHNLTKLRKLRKYLRGDFICTI